MAYSTTQLRTLWAPACTKKWAFKTAYSALDAWFKKYGYKVGTGSGAANCRQITGGTGYSLHSYFGTAAYTFWNGYVIPLMALAVDINPGANPYGPRLVTDMPRAMVDAIERVRTNNGKQVWRWGGYYTTNKDAMHYEIVCSPADLATGINPATLPQAAAPAPAPAPSPEEDDVAPFYVWFKDNRVAGKTYPTLKSVAEKGIVKTVTCYAIFDGEAVWQTGESVAIADYLNALGGKKTAKIGSGTKPENIVGPDGVKTSGWFAGCHIVDGPMRGMKKYD